MIVRKLGQQDLAQMFRVFDSQDYLLKIEKTNNIAQYYKKMLLLFVSDNPSSCAFGVFDNDRLIAFSTYNLLATLPCWSMGLFYTDSAYITSLHNTETIGILKIALVEYAESRRIYTAFSIATLNALGIRAWQHSTAQHSMLWPMWDGTDARYEVTVEEIIPPYSSSRYSTFGQMLGIVEGMNSVPLVVTKWTLANKYRNHALSVRHTKRLDKLFNA